MDINVPSYKIILGIFFTILCVIEIRRGFLKGFASYLKILSVKPYLVLGAIAFLMTFCFMPFDVKIITKLQSLQYPLLDQLIFKGAFFGKVSGTWGPLVALYFGALFLRAEKFQRLFFGALLSSALTGFVVHIIKFIALRARPYQELGTQRFFDVAGFMENHRAFQSFPSGDVGIAAGAAVFFFLALRRFYFSVLFLIVPLLTALSRMDLNKHWPSDTVFSFLISFAIAKFVLDYMLFLKPNSSAGCCKG